MSEEQKKQNPTTDEQQPTQKPAPEDQMALSDEELDAANGGILFNPKFPEIKEREKKGYQASFRAMYWDD